MRIVGEDSKECGCTKGSRRGANGHVQELEAAQIPQMYRVRAGVSNPIRPSATAKTGYNLGEERYVGGDGRRN